MVGASQVFVGVPLALAVFAVALFVQVVLMAAIPMFQVAGEFCLGKPEQAVGQGFQFLSGYRFGVAGQIASDDLLLMKLTQLEGNVGKQPGQAFETVCGDTLDMNALAEEKLETCRIVLGGFVSDVLQMEDLAVQTVEKHHDSEVSAKVGGVHDDVGDQRAMLRGAAERVCCLMDSTLDGFQTALMAGSQWL